jgi:putative ATP-binding cassette transporter
VVVITHDDRYFHLADRYVKLDYGQLVDSGAGAALLTRYAPTGHGPGTMPSVEAASA